MGALALHEAAIAGDARRIKKLLNTHPFRNTVDKDSDGGNTPLHWLAIHGHTEALRFFAKKQAKHGFHYHPPAWRDWIIRLGRGEPEATHIKRLVSINQRGETPMLAALMAGHVDTCIALLNILVNQLEAGESVVVPIVSLAAYAAFRGHTEVLIWLRRHHQSLQIPTLGINASEKTILSKCKPLHAAVFGNQVDAALYLATLRETTVSAPIQHKKDTVFHLAASLGHAALIDKLRRTGRFIGSVHLLRNSDDSSALDLAVHRNDEATVRALLKFTGGSQKERRAYLEKALRLCSPDSEIGQLLQKKLTSLNSGCPQPVYALSPKRSSPAKHAEFSNDDNTHELSIDRPKMS